VPGRVAVLPDAGMLQEVVQQVLLLQLCLLPVILDEGGSSEHLVGHPVRVEADVASVYVLAVHLADDAWREEPAGGVLAVRSERTVCEVQLPVPQVIVDYLVRVGMVRRWEKGIRLDSQQCHRSTGGDGA